MKHLAPRFRCCFQRIHAPDKKQKNGRANQFLFIDHERRWITKRTSARVKMSFLWDENTIALGTILNALSPTDCRHNQDLRAVGDSCRQSVSKTNRLIAHEYVDVLSDRALLIQNP